ncbi:hypothetical protein NKH18_32855 [Streptomyces sp. M10(2022)]
MESGRSGISADRVRTLARTYECANSALVEALAGMTAQRGTQWWDTYQKSLPAGFRDVAEMEWYARRLHIALTVHMPGLFQTEDHARAVFEHVIPGSARPTWTYGWHYAWIADKCWPRATHRRSS